MIKVDIGPETVGVTADDRQHERRVVVSRANHGLRAAPDADPGFERTVFDRRKDALVGERRTRMTLPSHRIVLQDCSKQIELFVKQRLVVGEIVAEQRKGLGEGAAAENDFGAAAGDSVERRKSLKDPDRVFRLISLVHKVSWIQLVSISVSHPTPKVSH
jgi:hypothetical protein